MTEILEQREGLRARKKRETQRRIADTALNLFLKKGYEATTLDEIAEEAGIGRRTFFSYYKSKEAILMTFIDNGFVLSFKPVLLAQPKDLSPLVAVRNSLLQLFAARDGEKALATYKLLESTEVLKARLQTVPREMENSIFEALCEQYPKPAMRDSLRMIAAVSVAVIRIGKEAWRNDEGRHPLATYLRDSFATLEQAI